MLRGAKGARKQHIADICLPNYLHTRTTARTGRNVPLPFRPTVSKPIDLWLGSDRVSSSPD